MNDKATEDVEFDYIIIISTAVSIIMATIYNSCYTVL